MSEETAVEQEVRVCELGVVQVVEKPQSSGYITHLVGFIAAPKPPSSAWDEPMPPQPEPEFFPTAEGIAVRVELDWSRFAGPRPAVAYYGSVLKLTLEPISVPTDPETGQLVDKFNGGLQRPIGRRV